MEKATAHIKELNAKLADGVGDEYFETVEKEAVTKELNSWVSQLKGMKGKEGDAKAAECSEMVLRMIDKRGDMDGVITLSEFLLFIMDVKDAWKEPNLEAWKSNMVERGILRFPPSPPGEQFEVVVESSGQGV